MPGTAGFRDLHGDVTGDKTTLGSYGTNTTFIYYKDGTNVVMTDYPHGATTEDVYNKDGNIVRTIRTDENGETTITEYPSEPDHADVAPGSQDGDAAKHGETAGGESSGEGEAGQPGLNDSSTGNADPCGWTPWGCRSARDVRTSIKQMTSQPVQDESGSTGTGSGAPRLGLEAVTNSGDGSWSPQTAGRSGGGHPIDMRDPAPRGPDGTPVRQN